MWIKRYTKPHSQKNGYKTNRCDILLEKNKNVDELRGVEISTPHTVEIKENKLVAAITDLGRLRYGRCKLTPLGLRLEEVWIDAVGLPRLTEKIRPCMNRTLHDVEMWHMGTQRRQDNRPEGIHLPPHERVGHRRRKGKDG